MVVTCGPWELRKLKSFGTWCCRSMLKIKYTDMTTNEEVVRKAGEKVHCQKCIEKRMSKVQFF